MYDITYKPLKKSISISDVRFVLFSLILCCDQLINCQGHMTKSYDKCERQVIVNIHYNK